MKLVTFLRGADECVGAIVDDRIADLTAAGFAPSMIDLILGGASGLEAARKAAAVAPTVPLSGTRLLAPTPRPGKILCCGINYKSHADENPKAVMPTEPFFFAKMASSVAGHEDEVEAPIATKQMDYEVEFAAVIGKRLSKAKEAEVMDAIFGYTLLNDLSARDVQFKDNQITLGKNFNRFAPMGPAIVTVDEMTDPNHVRLTTRLNGKLMQDGNTEQWLFRLPHLLSYLTQVMDLEPGDVVSTGTPAGIGYFQNPQVFLKPGDVVEIEGADIGVLRTTIVASH